MKPIKLIDRTKQLSRNEKIIAGVIIFFGLLILFNELGRRYEYNSEADAQQREYCRTLLKMSSELYMANKECNK